MWAPRLLRFAGGAGVLAGGGSSLNPQASFSKQGWKDSPTCEARRRASREFKAAPVGCGHECLTEADTISPRKDTP